MIIFVIFTHIKPLKGSFDQITKDIKCSWDAAQLPNISYAVYYTPAERGLVSQKINFHAVGRSF